MEKKLVVYKKRIISEIIISIYMLIIIIPNIMNPNINRNIKIIFIAPVLLNSLIIYMYQKKCHQLEEIIEERKKIYPPRRGILVDVLIYKYSVQTKKGMYNIPVYTPVIRDIETNRLYTEIAYYERSYEGTAYLSKENVAYQFKTRKKKRVKIGDQVNMHIITEIGNIENNNGRINIGNDSCVYYGKKLYGQIVDSTVDCYLYNIASDNFLNEASNITIFEGYTDFDI